MDIDTANEGLLANGYFCRDLTTVSRTQSISPLKEQLVVTTASRGSGSLLDTYRLHKRNFKRNIVKETVES